MRRLAAAVILSAALLGLVSCRKPAATAADSSAAASDIVGLVPKVALHPCNVTATQLTDEDCQAAQYWLDKASEGTASFNAPKRMIQGQTKLVTLAIGTAPPPALASESAPAASSAVPRSEEPAASSARPHIISLDIRHQVRGPSPHDTVAGTIDAKTNNIIDYHPFVGRQMAADLEGDGFDVTPLSPRVQAVSDESVTTWEWQVRARKFGTRNLIMKTAVIMIDSQGKADQLIPKSQSKSVSVWIGPDGILSALDAVPAWLKAIAAILVGIAAVITAWKGLPVLFRRGQGPKPPPADPRDKPEHT